MKSNRTSILLTAGLMATATALLGQPAIQFNPVAYTTGENASAVTLTVQRTGDTNAEVSVVYASTNDTAIAGVKYTAVAGTLAFAAGETKRTVPVPLLNDGFPGGTTTFGVTLGNPTGGAILGASATATVSILDPDGGITFRFAAYSVAEDVGAVLIGIVRGDDVDQPMSVDLTTTDGTGVEGRDYTGIRQTLVLPGDRRLSFVSVPILNNQIKDGNRSFGVTLTNPVGGTLGCTTTTTVTILDNDAGFEFESANYTVAEHGGSVLVRVRRGTDEATLSVAVDYTTSDGTGLDGTDYTGATGTLAFAPGEQVKHLAIPILNDGVKESAETFRVTLSNPTDGAELGAQTNATVSIQDNDPGAGFELTSHSVWAGTGELTLTVVRGSDATLTPFTVDYATADGTAKAGEDYQAISGTLEFKANETVKGLTISILGNAGAGLTRTFNVTVTNPTGGAVLGTASASVRIEANYCTVTPPFASGLAIQAEAGAHTLTWSGGGTLQRADQVTGPWQTLSTARSPWRTDPRTPASYYRVAHPRPASVYVPSIHDPRTPMPLVLLLHGAGDTGQGVEDYMRLRPLAESRGFLYCYPDGALIAGLFRGWNADDFSGDPAADWGAAITDDAGYLRDLIEEIARRFAVDRKRIYLAGRSNGGAMAYRMACQFSDLVAGIVSHAGISFFDSPWCIPSEAVNVLRLQSLADNYWGGPGIGLCDGFFVNSRPYPSAIRTVQDWAKYNGAGEPITDPELSMDLITDVPGLDTIVTRHPDHPPGGAVELWTLTGGPHRPSVGPDFSPAIIDWLLAHPKP